MTYLLNASAVRYEPALRPSNLNLRLKSCHWNVAVSISSQALLGHKGSSSAMTFLCTRGMSAESDNSSQLSRTVLFPCLLSTLRDPICSTLKIERLSIYYVLNLVVLVSEVFLTILSYLRFLSNRASQSKEGMRLRSGNWTGADGGARAQNQVSDRQRTARQPFSPAAGADDREESENESHQENEDGSEDESGDEIEDEPEDESIVRPLESLSTSPEHEISPSSHHHGSAAKRKSNESIQNFDSSRENSSLLGYGRNGRSSAAFSTDQRAVNRAGAPTATSLEDSLSQLIFSRTSASPSKDGPSILFEDRSSRPFSSSRSHSSRSSLGRRRRKDSPLREIIDITVDSALAKLLRSLSCR